MAYSATQSDYWRFSTFTWRTRSALQVCKGIGDGCSSRQVRRVTVRGADGNSYGREVAKICLLEADIGKNCGDKN